MTKTLLPGFGGRVLEHIPAVSYSNVYDLSLCAQFAVQITAKSGTVVIQVQQSFDGGVTWANFGSSIANLGAIVKFDVTDLPFGLIRVNQSAAIEDADVTIVGFPLQVVN